MRGKILAFAALLAFAAFATALGEVQVNNELDNALTPLTRAGGRSLKTLWGWSWWWNRSGWWPWGYNFYRWNDFYIGRGDFLAGRSWGYIGRDDWRYYDRFNYCSYYRSNCVLNAGAWTYYERRSFVSYWCPQTCGFNQCADFLPTQYCQDQAALGFCNAVSQANSNVFYNAWSRPFWYWCSATCGRCNDFTGVNPGFNVNPLMPDGFAPMVIGK